MTEPPKPVHPTLLAKLWFDHGTAYGEATEQYEAALGPFLVAFNRLDNTLSDVLEHWLHHLKRPDLLAFGFPDTIKDKVREIEMLTAGAGVAGYKGILGRVRALSHHRNAVAHGHVEPSYEDDGYVLIGSKRGAKEQDSYTPTRVRELTDECRLLWFELVPMTCHFMPITELDVD